MAKRLIKHIRYKKITDNSEYFFFINSNSLNEDIAFIQRNEIENVCLSEYEGYKLLQILPILILECIRNLRVYVKKIDLKDLNNLTSLEELSVGEEYQNLELTKLHNLKTLYLTNGRFTGLHALKSLKELTVVNANPDTFATSNFIEKSAIESLSIYNTKGKINFSFLAKLRNLKKLDLYNIKSEVDLRLFNSFAKTLEVLKIEKCKDLRHFEDCFAKFDSLRYLSLIDAVPISSAETVSQLKLIEIVVVLGTSYFVNGDISRLINLTHVSLDDKKHYSHKNDQLPKLACE
jgi:hypothetical protein